VHDILQEIDRAKPMKQVAESISGIVPELKKDDELNDSADDVSRI